LHSNVVIPAASISAASRLTLSPSWRSLAALVAPTVLRMPPAL